MPEKDWPTENFDMKLAASVIHKHVELNGGEPLLLLDVIFDEFQKSEMMKIPEWLLDLASCFMQQYGVEKGRQITEKVLTKCLLAGQTIH